MNVLRRLIGLPPRADVIRAYAAVDERDDARLHELELAHRMAEHRVSLLEARARLARRRRPA